MALIQSVRAAPDVVGPGQSVFVEAEVGDSRDAVVTINGVRGAAQHLQFRWPGRVEIVVTARRGEEIESRSVIVEVLAPKAALARMSLPAGGGGAPMLARVFGVGRVLPMARLRDVPSGQRNVYRRRIEVEVPEGVPAAGGRGPLRLSLLPPRARSYTWDFGDGRVFETADPHLDVDFAPWLSPRAEHQSFHCHITARDTELGDLSFSRTIGVHNAYALARSSGVVWQRAGAGAFAERVLGGFEARLRGRSADDQTVTLRSYSWQIRGGIGHGRGPKEPVALPDPVVLAPSVTLPFNVVIPLDQVPSDAAGLGLTVEGVTGDGVRVLFGADLRIRRRDQGQWAEGAEGTNPSRAIRPADESARVAGWRWCNRCQQLFAAGDSMTGGACAAGGAHDATGSGAYEMYAQETMAGGQADWLACDKCSTVYYGGHPTQGCCPTGGAHESVRGSALALRLGEDYPGAQGWWSWCARCEGLFFAGEDAVRLQGEEAMAGCCPAGGAHSRKGSGVYSVPLTSTQATVAPRDDRRAVDSPSEADEGTPVSDDALGRPPPEGWTIDHRPGDYEWRVLPGRWANAKKGDLVLSPGGSRGMVGALLRACSPAQRYSHIGIMTRDFTEVTHATSSTDRPKHDAFYRKLKVAGIDLDIPWLGIRADVLRYMFPGSITQPVEDAVFGTEGWPDPELKSSWQLGVFSSGPEHEAYADGVMEIVPPIVLKPAADAESTDGRIRAHLHRIADLSRERARTLSETVAGGARHSKTFHYRVYAYSYARIAEDVAATAAEAPWADGTRGGVCSSFLWYVMGEYERAVPGVNVLGGDRTENRGLTFYGKDVRRTAAAALYAKLYNNTRAEVLEIVTKALGGQDWLVDLFDFLGTVLKFSIEACPPLAFMSALLAPDGFELSPSALADRVGRAVASTSVNAFAFDRPEIYDGYDPSGIDAAWLISPDDMLRLPSVANGGLYGCIEPAQYLPPTRVLAPVYRWRRAPADARRCDLQVETTLRIAPALPVSGAAVRVGGQLTAPGTSPAGVTRFFGLVVPRSAGGVAGEITIALPANESFCGRAAEGGVDIAVTGPLARQRLPVDLDEAPKDQHPRRVWLFGACQFLFNFYDLSKDHERDSVTPGPGAGQKEVINLPEGRGAVTVSIEGREGESDYSARCAVALQFAEEDEVHLSPEAYAIVRGTKSEPVLHYSFVDAMIYNGPWRRTDGAENPYAAPQAHAITALPVAYQHAYDQKDGAWTPPGGPAQPLPHPGRYERNFNLLQDVSAFAVPEGWRLHVARTPPAALTPEGMRDGVWYVETVPYVGNDLNDQIAHVWADRYEVPDGGTAFTIRAVNSGACLFASGLDDSVVGAVVQRLFAPGQELLGARWYFEAVADPGDPGSRGCVRVVHAVHPLAGTSAGATGAPMCLEADATRRTVSLRRRNPARPEQHWVLTPERGFAVRIRARADYELELNVAGDAGGAVERDGAPLILWPQASTVVRPRGKNGAFHNFEAVVYGPTPFNQLFRLERWSAPDAAVPTEGGCMIVARHSGQCLDVAWALREPGAAVWQQEPHGGINQRWFFARCADGGRYFHLFAFNQGSGLCLEVVGGAMEPAEVRIAAFHGGIAQQFEVVAEEGPWVRIHARHSGLCLNVSGGGGDPGALLIQWPYDGRERTPGNELFRLVPLE